MVFRELEDGREWRTETCSCFDNTETCLPGIIPCVLGGTIVEVSEIVSNLNCARLIIFRLWVSP